MLAFRCWGVLSGWIKSEVRVRKFHKYVRNNRRMEKTFRQGQLLTDEDHRQRNLINIDILNARQLGRVIRPKNRQ